MVGEIKPAARPWPDSVHTMIADQRAEIARLLEPSGQRTVAVDVPTAPATRQYFGPPLNHDTTPPSAALDKDVTDPTPLTTKALLPQTFTNDEQIEFALPGAARPYATPDNPVLVSVMVIPFQDSGDAAISRDYLMADGPW